MKNDKLIPGMILVLIGAAFLLHNFGYIHFQWNNIWHLWPIFLVIGGVNLLFAHNRSVWATTLKITVIVGGFALILFGNFNYKNHWWPGYHYRYNKDNDDGEITFDSDDDDDDNNEKIAEHSTGDFRQPYEAAIKVARLTVSGGATNYRLNDTTTDLFKADTKSTHGRYELMGHKMDSIYILNFNMKENHVWSGDNHANTANIMLNVNPEWELIINVGATDLNFDLSKYKLRSLELNGGAGSFVLKVGEPLQTTNINVSSGAADVTINIPANAACQIESSTGLSSTSYEGFDKKENGRLETANFDGAKNKIFIHISGLAGDFKVHKY